MSNTNGFRAGPSVWPMPGKVKLSANPESDASEMKGIVVISTPKDTSLSISWGVRGCENEKRTRWDMDSGIIEAVDASYKANPEM